MKTRCFCFLTAEFIFLAACCVVLLNPACGSPLLVQEENAAHGITVTRLALGFNGTGRVGNWLPVELRATGLKPAARVRLHITASNPKGDPCESLVAETTVDESGSAVLRGVFAAGRQDGAMRLVLADSNGTELWRHAVACRTETLPLAAPAVAGDSAESAIDSSFTLIRHQPVTLLTAGLPAGLTELFDRLQSSTATQESLRLLTVASNDDLPTLRRGLDSIDTILLVTDFGVSAQQTQAIRDWVLTGGTLIVSAGDNLPELMNCPLGSWLQSEFGIRPELVRSQDLTALQNFVAGASQLQTNREDVSIVQLTSDQTRTIVESINGPLISRMSCGAGTVTFVAVDLTDRPLNRWLSLSQFYEILLFGRQLDVSGEEVRRSSRISSTGVTDLATQLANVSDAVPSDQRWTSWQAMLLILTYLVVIGPLDYLLVVRLLDRPRLTWLTFPLLVATACGLTVWWSAGKIAAATVREVHLLDVGQSGQYQTARTRSWSSLSTADSRYGKVTAEQPRLYSGSDRQLLEESLMWHGRAEDVYGGLYRPGGAGLGQRTSRRSEVGESGFSSIPLVVAGSQAFVAETFADTSAQPLFESRLVMTPSGLLEGSFVHHLPAAIRDWVIVLGNRVYLPSERAEDRYRQIAPEDSWSRRSGSVRVTDIRDFLRGVRVVERKVKPGNLTQSATTSVQTPYDISGKNPLDILIMISLYNTAGGEIYVHLQDDYLRRDEVSDAVHLNTAMLIGVADLPTPRLRLDGVALEPAASRTIVRFFLPVRRSSETEVPAAVEPVAVAPP